VAGGTEAEDGQAEEMQVRIIKKGWATYYAENIATGEIVAGPGSRREVEAECKRRGWVIVP